MKKFFDEQQVRQPTFIGFNIRELRLLKVAEILNQPNRNWTSEPPASDDDILRLIQTYEVSLPEAYLDLLRYANGGVGELALPPRLFYLYNINEVIGMLGNEFYREGFPNFFFFGGNGGLELLAFDLRQGMPYPIVMIDPIAGAKSALQIAPDMTQFIESMGLEYED